MNKNEILEGTLKICECYMGKTDWLFSVLPTSLASENGKRNVVPCAQSKSVIREVDPNYFMIIIFRMAIKKKHQTTTKPVPPSPNNL